MGAQVMKELDTTNDGRIDEKEFTCWYVSSKDQISSNLRPIFEKFDTNNSGTIEREELKLLLEKIDPRVTESDVDAALQACHQSGSENEISFDEFTDWYMSSMCYEKSVENLEIIMMGYVRFCTPKRRKLQGHSTLGIFATLSFTPYFDYSRCKETRIRTVVLPIFFFSYHVDWRIFPF